MCVHVHACASMCTCACVCEWSGPGDTLGKGKLLSHSRVKAKQRHGYLRNVPGYLDFLSGVLCLGPAALLTDPAVTVGICLAPSCCSQRSVQDGFQSLLPKEGSLLRQTGFSHSEVCTHVYLGLCSCVCCLCVGDPCVLGGMCGAFQSSGWRLS